MVIYEITAEISGIAPEVYEKYMRETHIPDLLATGFFARAFFTRAADTRYRIQYHAKSADALQQYLQTDAPRLREHFAEQFPAGVHLNRENWEVIESWNA